MSEVEKPRGIDARFQQHLEEGRFMIQRARASGRAFFHPRLAEPGTGDTDLEWFEPSGRGVVYSTTVVRARPPTPPYNVALVDLEEGPRLTTRVVGIDPFEVRIGMEVQARIEQVDGRALLVFTPREPRT
ncbi:OB-fold domain-containing protein [uncultured Pseudacidovorax sp.]|uniref:Zn-ribbon domain-containing OB-fold protein n=1 Tax=uncultured Pseudacidovorax sp. TaxID=679313 RepID=UPI0025FD6BA6|nr:OB-fold domain-containing protein [uncultured Pseudacidovorax sp.]